MKILILLFAIISAVICTSPVRPRYTDTELIIQDNCFGISQRDTTDNSGTTNKICCDETFASNTALKGDLHQQSRLSGIELLQRNSEQLMRGKTNCRYTSQGIR